jgi:hypothetical protein
VRRNLLSMLDLLLNWDSPAAEFGPRFYPL